MQAVLESTWQSLLRRVPPNSVLYYPGIHGGAATIIDRSGSGNDGVIFGAIARRLHNGLWYYDFDGINDKVTITNSASITPGTDDWSIRAWVRVPPNAAREGLLSSHASSTGFYCDVLITGLLRVSFADFVGAVSNYVYVDSNTAIDNNIWHQLGISWDISLQAIKIYIDKTDVTGTLAAVNTVTNVTNGADLTLGFSVPSGGVEYLDFDWVLLGMRRSLMSQADYTDFYHQERHIFGI